MRELTAAEKAELEKRKAGFAMFREERMPVLHKFAEILECPEPHEILIMPEKFLPYISKYMEEQVIQGDNRTWLLTRIGYFIGELLVSKFDGCWMVDERVDSDTFSRYVVGEFAGMSPEKVIDPFQLAQIYVDSAPPRSLVKQFEDIVKKF
jgi:hypothetical protein